MKQILTAELVKTGESAAKRRNGIRQLWRKMSSVDNK
jgi:hypothetical protein